MAIIRAVGSHVVRRRETRFLTGGLITAIGMLGCVESFGGSNVQIDLGPATPVQASPGVTPAGNQLPSNAHFTLYAVDASGGENSLFAVQRFEVHRIVDVASPCFIDVGEHVPHEGLHVSQFGTQIAIDTGIMDVRNPPADATEQQRIDAATAAQRMANIAALGGPTGIKVVTSASEGGYPAVAADCTGPADQLPPPTCLDPASNERRLRLCQAAWAADPMLWEGTDRVLTAPLAGTTYGMVVGLNPINLAPVGGAQFFVDEELSMVDAFAIYWQVDGMPDPGNLLLYGTPSKPTRGVTHVHMTSPSSPALTAEVAIFADLGDDQVHF